MILDTQLKNILRIYANELVDKQVGIEDLYEQRESDYRVRIEGASVQGYNETNLIYEGSQTINQPVYHKINGVHRNAIYLRCGIIDAQTHHEANILTDMRWSVTLDCR